MRESTPTWSFRKGVVPSALSISLDGKFAGVGHKNGLLLLNNAGGLTWSNKKIRRVRDISLSTRTGKMAVGSGQKVVYLVDRKGSVLWHRELQGAAVSTSISSDGNVIVVGTSLGRLIVFDGKGKMLWETHLSNSEFPVNSVNISSDGKFIVAGTSYSHIYLHDIKGRILWAEETTGEVLQTCISSNGDYLGYLTSDYKFSFAVKSSRILWTQRFSNQPRWIDMTQTADFVAIGESATKVTLFNKAGRKVWGLKPRSAIRGVMASGGGSIFVGGPKEICKYSLDPYLKRLLARCKKMAEKANSENLDTTTANKYIDLAISSLQSSNHLEFLVNVQQARQSTREARVIESDLTSNERRIERNEMEELSESEASSGLDSSEDTMLSKLVQLAEMRENGLLSEEEFVLAKAKLLNI